MTGKGNQPATRNRVTLVEVAADAGVSRATASLVLRGSPLVAKETRERVLASVERLDYVHHHGAASLRTKSSHAVGVIIPSISNPFFAELTQGIEARLNEAGYIVLLGNSAETLRKQDELLATMRGYRVDGFLLCPAEHTPIEVVRRVRHGDFPLVTIGRYLCGSDVDYVGVDNASGAEQAVEQLLARGHRRIAFIGGPVNSSTWHERMRGYRQALGRHGLTIREVSTTDDTRGGYEAIRDLLAQPQPPTAALCCDDTVALGVMFGLEAIGRRPGRDFAVIGFNDIAEAALVRPSLTTVSSVPYQIGSEAVTLLLERIANGDAPPRRVILPPRLILRESSGEAINRESTACLAGNASLEE